MHPVNYRANKKKRQTPKSLALEGIAPPELSSSTVAEMPPTVKRMGRPPKDPAGKASALLGIRITPGRHAIYKIAAEFAGKSLTDWVLDTLDRAVIGRNARKPGTDE